LNEATLAAVTMYGSVVITSMLVHGVLFLLTPGIGNYIAGSFVCLLLGPWVFLAIAELASGAEAFWPIAFFVVLLRTWYIPLLVGIPTHVLGYVRQLKNA